MPIELLSGFLGENAVQVTYELKRVQVSLLRLGLSEIGEESIDGMVCLFNLPLFFVHDLNVLTFGGFVVFLKILLLVQVGSALMDGVVKLVRDYPHQRSFPDI